MAANRSLQKLMEQFINEKFELRQIGTSQLARLHLSLVGYPRFLDAPGFIVFLKRLGISRPSVSDLNSSQIGAFWEYLARYHGLLTAAQAMRSLRAFWRWMESNRLVLPDSMPADLKASDLKKLYKVDSRITKLE